MKLHWFFIFERHRKYDIEIMARKKNPFRLIRKKKKTEQKTVRHIEYRRRKSLTRLNHKNESKRMKNYSHEFCLCSLDAESTKNAMDL